MEIQTNEIISRFKNDIFQQMRSSNYVEQTRIFHNRYKKWYNLYTRHLFADDKADTSYANYAYSVFDRNMHINSAWIMYIQSTLHFIFHIFLRYSGHLNSLYTNAFFLLVLVQ